MRLRWTIFSILAFVLGAGAYAQNGRERLIDSIAHPEISASGEMMLFMQTVVDVGTISEESAPREYEFHWTNVGEVPVTVLKVTTTCGCAVPSFDSRKVNPGEQSSLTVTYHPKGHPGTFDRRIFVYTDLSGAKPAAVLSLKGNVTPSSKPVWAFAYQMGNLYLKQREVRFSGESMATERIFCLNAGDRPLTVGVESKLLPPYLTFRCEPETIPPGEFADLVISFDPAAVPVRLLDSVPLILTGIDVPPSQRTVRVLFGREN